MRLRREEKSSNLFVGAIHESPAGGSVTLPYNAITGRSGEGRYLRDMVNIDLKKGRIVQKP